MIESVLDIVIRVNSHFYQVLILFLPEIFLFVFFVNARSVLLVQFIIVLICHFLWLHLPNYFLLFLFYNLNISPSIQFYSIQFIHCFHTSQFSCFPFIHYACSVSQKYRQLSKSMMKESST